MKIYNTLSRQKEEFQPQGEVVTIYSCGVTPYAESHLGHAMNAVIFDTVRRYLIFRGYKVKFVQNITDVEDKIIDRANKLGIPPRELAEKFAGRYFEDMAALNVMKPDITPYATEEIPKMLEVIKGLLDNGHAYAVNGSVYFRVRSMPDYGKLSHRRVGDQSATVARIKNDDYDKEEMADFALWKAWDEKDGDVKWDSPWGPGRPGWHIECSVMSMQHLGETFDIHCGGEDLIFPHHEDEIAQSEAANGKPFVRYWLHNAHLLVEGKKMSRRLNNFYTLRDLLAKGWSGREIRYVLLSAHYRDQLNFTMDGLQAARSALQRMDEFLLKLDASPAGTVPDLQSRFDAAMDDDLNTSAALGALFEFIREANKRTIVASEAAAILATWQRIDQVLGFGLPVKSEAPADVLALVEERRAARKARNFKRSDEIRDQLAKQGWVVEDTPKGPRAKRVG